MKKLLVILLFSISSILYSQNTKPQKYEALWDQGVPILPSDPYIMGLITDLGESLREWDYASTKSKAKVCREIGLAFYDKGLYDAADWYLTKSKNYREEAKVEKVEPKLTENELKSLESDKNILEKLPKNFDTISKNDLKNLVSEVESQIKKLMKERDSLINTKASKTLIDSKNGTIKTLNKERDFIKLNIKNSDLKDENSQIRSYLFWSLLLVGSLALLVIVLLQRKKIKIQDSEIISQLKEITKKNSYLEHAARLIRHDMHSGINTYIPKGISTLERKLTPEDIQKLKIESPLKMIKDGLGHTQKVYKSVYEFTNLVKQNVVLEKKKVNIQDLLKTYFSTTSYSQQIKLNTPIEMEVNETLFCNAIDNLVRNGLKYNDEIIKNVNIYLDNNYLIVEDNGRGLTQKQFDKIINNYNDKKDKNSSGLGLNICLTILEEHGFELTCEKIETGTKMKINLKKN